MWILLFEFLKTYAKLVKAFLSLGLYGDTDHRILGNLHSLKLTDRMILVAEECHLCG